MSLGGTLVPFVAGQVSASLSAAGMVGMLAPFGRQNDGRLGV